MSADNPTPMYGCDVLPPELHNRLVLSPLPLTLLPPASLSYGPAPPPPYIPPLPPVFHTNSAPTPAHSPPPTSSHSHTSLDAYASPSPTHSAHAAVLSAVQHRHYQPHHPQEQQQQPASSADLPSEGQGLLPSLPPVYSVLHSIQCTKEGRAAEQAASRGQAAAYTVSTYGVLLVSAWPETLCFLDF